MDFLLDTHTFLWFVNDDPALSPRVKTILMDGRNRRLLSVASIWEMAIKVQCGKLEFAKPFPTFLHEQVEKHQITICPILAEYAIGACDLQYATKTSGEHKDPFDRLIVLQSKLTSTPLLSNEVIFEQYGIQRIW